MAPKRQRSIENFVIEDGVDYESDTSFASQEDDVVAETDSSSNESEDDEHLSEEELGDLGIKFASTTTKSKKSKKTSSKKQPNGRQGRELRKRAKVDYKIPGLDDGLFLTEEEMAWKPPAKRTDPSQDVGGSTGRNTSSSSKRPAHRRRGGMSWFTSVPDDPEISWPFSKRSKGECKKPCTKQAASEQSSSSGMMRNCTSSHSQNSTETEQSQMSTVDSILNSPEFDELVKIADQVFAIIDDHDLESQSPMDEFCSTCNRIMGLSDYEIGVRGERELLVAIDKVHKHWWPTVLQNLRQFELSDFVLGDLATEEVPPKLAIDFLSNMEKDKRAFLLGLD